MLSWAQDVSPGDTVLLSCSVYIPVHTLVAVRAYYVDAFTADPAKEEDELCQSFVLRLGDSTVTEADIISAMSMMKWEDTPCGPRTPQWLRRRRLVQPNVPPPAP